MAGKYRGYIDPTGDTAAARVDRARDQMDLNAVAYMAVCSLLSRHASNAQCADMMRGLSRWWVVP